ncbi:MAG: hypothetical protein AAGE05_15510 [Pseudomonadota bacterium]
MIGKIAKTILWLLVILIVLAIGAILFLRFSDRESTEPIAFEGAATERPYWDENFEPQPVPGTALFYPGVAPDGNATIHADAAQSDVHMAATPMGENLEIRSRQAGGRTNRQCATMTFRSDGLMVTMCGGLWGFRLVLIDPDSLEALATHDLPMRPSAFQSLIHRDLSYTFSDSSGGAYFVLDDQDRVIVGDPGQQIKRLVAEQENGRWAFRIEEQWDMQPHVPNDCLHYNNWFPSGECDAITTVMPGPEGRYWWTTRFGRLGTLDPESGEVRTLFIEGEEIQNALAVDTDAVYVLTDHAQYAFRAGPGGEPRQLWRHAYDRGTSRKLGSINQGSGTTPTLLGENYITFTDNADGRINLIVLRRGALAEGEERQICSIPLFADGASAAENSMIGWNRSIIIENNSGYTNAMEHENWGGIAPGVTRVDIREDESGCDIVWESDLIVPSVVPKLSQPLGIAYFYSFDLGADGVPNWYIAGLDFITGELVQKIPTGRGPNWDNNWSAIAVGPDGSLYVGTSRGLLQVRER